MNSGRGGNRGGRSGGKTFGTRSAVPYVVRGSPAAGSSGDASSTLESGSSHARRRQSEAASVDGMAHKFNDLSTSEHPRGPNSETISTRNSSPNASTSKQNVYQSPKPSFSPPLIAPRCDNDYPALSMTPQTVQSCMKKEETCREEDCSIQAGESPEGPRTKVECEGASSQNKGFSFDICEEKNKSGVRLKPSLLVRNKANRKEKKRFQEGENIQNIRAGMILLKGYLSLTDQVKLIKSCRDLGKGPGGFYEPSYRDGAALHLKMMCLGRHWDPDTGEYHDARPNDETKPPPIPDEFLQLVKQAIKKCHDYLESDSKGMNVSNIVPSMSPDICITNFYTKTGKLGLHQDKDETPESIRKNLPVVSFSLGDTAEFLYGDERDVDKADKIELESGDVLIFGGKSRLVFHGVSSIKPDTAPEALKQETNLKPGRLNLTFRKY